MKKLYALYVFLLLSFASFAQAYNMSTTSVSTCSGNFYDSGGPSANYGNNQSLTMTFNSANGNRLQFAFTSFSIETCCDRLYIYDGPSSAYPLIGVYNSSPGTVQSSGTSITFVFTSDASGTGTGWDATISCTTAPLVGYNMSNGTVTACSGAFYDNGGPNTSYGNSLTLTQTFCSGTTDYLRFTFLNAATNIVVGDTLFVYDGANTSAPLIAAYTAASTTEAFTSSGTCVTFYFKSNATTNASGWACNFACTTSPPTAGVYSMSGGIRGTCNATFYDPGGPSSNYGNNESRTMAFQSYNGNRVSVTFNTFSVETCCDRLYIYDGPTASYPLIGIYNSNPGTITSTGNALCFVFTSDASGTQAGWDATVTCTSPVLTSYPMSSGTVTACSGSFFDSGGPQASYPNGQTITQTFCSGTSDMLQFSFWTAATNIVVGDTLFVYDGPTTSSPLIAAYTAASTMESFTSAGTCVTFFFKSNASGNASGWAGWFGCTTTPASPGVYSMSGGIRGTCNATFYDPGGPSSNYGNNESRTMAFQSYNGNRVSVTFNTFSVETCCDRLYIYDGPTASYPLIGIYNSNPGTITSTGNALCFVFTSDASGTQPGWDATVTCTTPVLTSYPMSSGTVTACSGSFFDSGGPQASYPNGQTLTQTFCSGTSSLLQFSFWTAATNIVVGDTLFVYDGPTTSSPLIAAYTAASTMESFTSAGTCVTFFFKSNASSNASGWAGWFGCTTTPASPGVYTMSGGIRGTCNATFYDPGGPSANYGNNESRTMAFQSYNGNRVSVTFNTFSVETCCDRLYIYDGPTASYPLIGIYNSNPGTITSTGNALCFVFTSDASGTQPGWDATVTCTSPVLTSYPMSSGTVTACSGSFFDSGGPQASYPNGQTLTQTFCSGTSDMLQFSFWTAATNIVVGDTLFVYDGPTTSSPLIAAYTAASTMESFTSAGTCVTFFFKSNASGNASGWAGWFGCTTTPASPGVYTMSGGIRGTCNATFYDPGGPSSNYGNNESRTMTFQSYNGNRVSVTFTSFSVETCCDRLYAYDGPNASYPLLGAYSSNPGTITSSGSSICFVFTSDASGTQAGWVANVTCSTPVLPVYSMSSGTVTTCEGVFYDNGGPTANYPNNENRVMTFTSANGQYLKFDFNPNHFNITTGDSLFIYDGASTAAPLFAILTGNTSPGALTSNTSSFTFRFKSNASGVNVGWQAWISCVSAPDNNPVINMSAGVRYTCGGTFNDVGGTAGNYPNNENRTMTFYSNSGCGIRFTFTAFATESCCDRLYVYDGPSTAAPLIGTYSGGTLPPVLQSSGSALTFLFSSDASSNQAGWSATISCPTQPLASITPSGPTNICSGGNVVLTAAPNATYLWNTGATTQSITVNTNGTYWVTVTNVSGCTATSTIVPVSVTNPPVPTVTSGGPTTFCQGGSVTLSTTASGTLLWSNNATTNSINVTQSGSYTVTSTDGNGCSATSSPVNVTVNAAPSALVTPSGPTTFCQGGSVTLSAPAGNTYLWSNNATSSSINVTQSGTYSVTVTNGFGCSATSAPVVVTVNTSPNAVVTAGGPLTFCQGNSVTLTASGGTTYTWSDNSSAGSLVVTQSGNYYVIAHNGTCSDTSSTVSVTVNPVPSAAITTSGPTSFCQGGSVTLSVPAGNTYLWSNNATTNSINVTQSGTYSVTVTNSFGCSVASSPVTVTVNTTPNAVITAGGPLTFCQGNSLTLTASGGTTYTWSDNSTASSLIVTQSGTYSVIAYNGTCSDTSAPVNVTVNPSPTASISASGPTSFCQGGSVVLSVPAGDTYLWSNNATSNSITVTQSGTYSVTVTNSFGCSVTSSPVTVNVNATPNATITAGGPLTFCQGGSVMLNASGGTTYSWSDNSSGSSLMVNQSGTYYVIAYNGTCFDTSATVSVTVNALPNVTLTLPMDTFCDNAAPVTLSGGSPAGGIYSGPGVSGGVLNPAAAGVGLHTITYSYTDANNCGNTAQQTIFVDLCSGIAEEEVFGFAVMPNPAHDFVTVLISSGNVSDRIRITDLSGREIISEQIAGRTSIIIPIEKLAAGVYLLQLEGDLRHTVKLIKE